MCFLSMWHFIVRFQGCLMVCSDFSNNRTRVLPWSETSSIRRFWPQSSWSQYLWSWCCWFWSRWLQSRLFWCHESQIGRIQLFCTDMGGIFYTSVDRSRILFRIQGVFCKLQLLEIRCVAVAWHTFCRPPPLPQFLLLHTLLVNPESGNRSKQKYDDQSVFRSSKPVCKFLPKFLQQTSRMMTISSQS